MRAGAYLRINAPVGLFLLGAGVTVAAALSTTGAARVLALLAAWWCAAGAVMLLIDFPRKRALWERLRREPSLAWRRLPRSITGTLCGLCVLWAARYRTRRVRRTGSRERSINEEAIRVFGQGW